MCYWVEYCIAGAAKAPAEVTQSFLTKRNLQSALHFELSKIVSFSFFFFLFVCWLSPRDGGCFFFNVFWICPSFFFATVRGEGSCSL